MKIGIDLGGSHIGIGLVEQNNLKAVVDKFFTQEDRKNIEGGLNEKKSINQIAKELGRSHSTILREIDRNKKYSEPSAWNNHKINHPDLDL